jgi:hypothetical protein
MKRSLTADQALQLVEQADRAQQTIDAVMRDWVKSRVDLLCRRHLERKGGASNAAKA